jgi:ligand-binding sensor domain-containing protein
LIHFSCLILKSNKSNVVSFIAIKTYLVLLHFLLLSLLSKAQSIPSTVNSINYSVDKGLPSSETYDVFADSRGFIWIGTDRGVARFDGNRFEVFTSNDGLSGNTVLRLFEDSQKRIWIATYNLKLCYYENGRFHPYRYNHVLDSALSGSSLGAITLFTIDTAGNLYADFINSQQLHIDAKGNYNLRSSDYSAYIKSIQRHRGPDTAFFPQVMKILRAYPLSTKLTIDHQSEKKHFALVGDDLVYCGKKGLMFYDSETFALKRHLFNNYFITGITTDFESGIWLSTLNSGVLYVPETFTHFFPTQSLNNNPNILALFPQEHKVFIGFTDFQFFAVNSSEQRLNKVDSPANFYAIDRELRYKGLKFEYSFPLAPFENKVKAFLQLHPDTILYTSNSSVITLRYKNPTGNWKEHNITGLKVNKIVRDKAGNIWLATFQGLYLFKTKQMHFEKYNGGPSSLEDRIQDILVMEDSTLLIATDVNGVLFKKNEHFSQLTTDHGLLSNTVNQLFYDPTRQVCWVAGNKGISGFHYTGELPRKMHYKINASTGLKSTDCRVLFILNDSLYFGTNGGVSVLSLSNLKIDTVRPRIFKESILVNQQAIDSLSHSLSYNQNNLQFTFRGISFNCGKELRYQFCLNGIDSSKQYTRQTELDFFSLPPGDYKLSVNAINPNGVKSKSIHTSFSILPPFWGTWWFRLLFFCLSGLLLLLIIRQVIHKQQLKARLQIDVLRFQSMNLQAKMNPHFIFNSLNSIQHYILARQADKANDYLLDFSKLARQVLKNSDATEVLLTEELKAIKLYAALEAKRLDNSFQFSIEADPLVKAEKCLIPALLIQPFIENAIWHGKLTSINNAKIVLRYYLKDQLLFFEIEDNGLGYHQSIKNKKSSSKSYGTSISRERIELLNKLHPGLSELSISNAEKLTCSASNLGTLILFHLPYKLT